MFTLVDPNSVFEIVNGTLQLKAGMFLELASGTPVQVGVTATDSGNPAAAITRTLPINVVSNPSPWRCPDDWLDVNADGQIVPFDVLYIINELNTPTVIGSDGMLPTARPANAAYYYDTNGDRYGTPMDALWVINYLNDGLRTEGEYNGHRWYETTPAGTWGTNYVTPNAAQEPDDGQHAAIDDYFAEDSGSDSDSESNNLTPARESSDSDGLVMDLESVLDAIAPLYE